MNTEHNPLPARFTAAELATKSDRILIRGSILGALLLYAAWIPMKLFGLLPYAVTWFMVAVVPVVLFHAVASMGLARLMFPKNVLAFLGYVLASVALFYLVLAIAGAPLPVTASSTGGSCSGP